MYPFLMAGIDGKQATGPVFAEIDNSRLASALGGGKSTLEAAYATDWRQPS